MFGWSKKIREENQSLVQEKMLLNINEKETGILKFNPRLVLNPPLNNYGP